jgi:hypothetical protein
MDAAPDRRRWKLLSRRRFCWHCSSRVRWRRCPQLLNEFGGHHWGMAHPDFRHHLAHSDANRNRALGPSTTTRSTISCRSLGRASTVSSAATAGASTWSLPKIVLVPSPLSLTFPVQEISRFLPGRISLTAAPSALTTLLVRHMVARQPLVADHQTRSCYPRRSMVGGGTPPTVPAASSSARRRAQVRPMVAGPSLRRSPRRSPGINIFPGSAVNQYRHYANARQYQFGMRSSYPGVAQAPLRWKSGMRQLPIIRM